MSRIDPGCCSLVFDRLDIFRPCCFPFLFNVTRCIVDCNDWPWRRMANHGVAESLSFLVSFLCVLRGSVATIYPSCFLTSSRTSWALEQLSASRATDFQSEILSAR